MAQLLVSCVFALTFGIIGEGGAQNITRDDCMLPADTGPCLALMQRYFFNNQTHQCEQFTYGGCQGNANNFKTPGECEQKCRQGYGNDKSISSSEEKDQNVGGEDLNGPRLPRSDPDPDPGFKQDPGSNPEPRPNPGQNPGQNVGQNPGPNPGSNPVPNPCVKNDCKRCETCVPESRFCIQAPCPQYRCEKKQNCA